jgi:hypothetical protein
VVVSRVNVSTEVGVNVVVVDVTAGTATVGDVVIADRVAVAPTGAVGAVLVLLSETLVELLGLKRMMGEFDETLCSKEKEKLTLYLQKNWPCNVVDLTRNQLGKY